MSVICDRFDTLGQEDPARTYRLGIMGGTFDPIHMGHLVCAEQARDALELDGVIFMPAGNPVFKKHIEVSDAHHRVAMCRAAIEDNPAFDVTDADLITAFVTERGIIRPPFAPALKRLFARTED